MNLAKPNPSIRPREIFNAAGKILAGRAPILSIEITHECPNAHSARLVFALAVARLQCLC
jgi:hypothetical protein